MGVQLKSKGGVRSEGVGVKIREALGDVGMRESEPEIMDRTAERRCFAIQVQDVLLLLLSEYQWDRNRSHGTRIIAGTGTGTFLSFWNFLLALDLCRGMSGMCYVPVLSSGALWLCSISGGARWQCNGCAMAVLSSSTTGVQRLCSVVGLSGYALGSSWIRC
ncbi:hypothetical protein ACFX12_008283 [Malus domestica]